MHKFTLLAASLLLSLPLLAQDYQLVWNEDFTESTLDRTAWNIEVNGDGGGNNELQYYCEKAVSLGTDPVEHKHCLILTATKENYAGKTCTSGRVTTSGKMNFTYGKVEARIWFPKTANGLWPAFWMLGQNINSVGWPRCGETDIIEMGHKDGFNGRQESYFNGAMHVGSAWNTVWQDVSAQNWDYSLQDGFHVLTCEWTPTSVTMYVDKDQYPSREPYFSTPLEWNEDANYNRQLVWSKPSFVIFNLAVGGNFPGIYNVNQVSALDGGPKKMYIDWLRVYQRGDASETFMSKSASDAIEQEASALVGVDAEQAPQKIMRDGRIVIVRGRRSYAITGELIGM